MNSIEPTKRPCFLRQSFVKLLDGVSYSFRALPMNRRVIEHLENSHTPSSQLELIEISLGFDMDAESVQALLDSGAIPLTPGEEGSEEARIHDEITAAMIQQATKQKAGGK